MNSYLHMYTNNAILFVVLLGASGGHEGHGEKTARERNKQAMMGKSARKSPAHAWHIPCAHPPHIPPHRPPLVD